MHLVFIAGWMRSGTTLLAELVGSCPGGLSLGELDGMWAALDRSESCSCGEPLTQCPIWRPVAEQVQSLHGIGPGRATSYLEFHALVRRVLKTKRLLSLRRLRSQHVDRWPEDVRRVVEVMRTVLWTAGHAGGSSVLVDSSKRPTALLTLALVPDLTVVPLHLVRDPRAVAYSESGRREWQGVGQHLAPPGRSEMASALFWNFTAVTSHLLGTRFPGYRLLRYERLAARPREYMTDIARGLGMPPPAFEGADMAAIAANHLIEGNPSRFGDRLRQIKADERWRSQLPTRKRMAVTVLTAPVRLWLWVISRYAAQGRPRAR